HLLGDRRAIPTRWAEPERVDVDLPAAGLEPIQLDAGALPRVLDLRLDVLVAGRLHGGTHDARARTAPVGLGQLDVDRASALEHQVDVRAHLVDAHAHLLGLARLDVLAVCLDHQVDIGQHAPQAVATVGVGQHARSAARAGGDADLVVVPGVT